MFSISPFFFVDSFWVFSYAYGGLHRWSSRGKKAAKVVFDSQQKKKKKTHTHTQEEECDKKRKKRVNHDLTNYR